MQRFCIWISRNSQLERQTFGVGQINSLNAEELGKLKNRMLPFMEKAREDEGLDMIFFMLTNILTETTELLCVGQGRHRLWQMRSM